MEIVSATCTTNGFTNTGPTNASINSLMNDACTQAGNGTVIKLITNNATGDVVGNYAIYGGLVSNTSGFFCIDSTGKTNQSASAATTVTCP